MPAATPDGRLADQAGPAASGPSAALRRAMPSLDGLRGVAIGGVLLAHLLNAWPGHTRLDEAVVGALGLGWAGVDLFFVLSGLLITGILVDTLGARGWWTAFLARRALRIFPLYFLTLALFGLLGPAAGLIDPWTFGRWGWWYWSYLGNWAFAANQVIPALSHFWSLAVEEQFYLAWPAVVLLARGRRLLLVAGLLVLTGPIFRAVIVHWSGWPVGSAYRVTPGRLDALALGALLAVALRDAALVPWVARRWRPALAVGLLGFVALGLAQGPFDMHRPAMEIWSHSLLGLGFAGLTAGAVLGEGGAPAAGTAALRRVLLLAPLQALGRYSYGLYVVHYFVHRGALEALRASEAGRALLAGRAGYLLYAAGGAAASLALAVLSFHLLERRFLAWKRFFVARP